MATIFAIHDNGLTDMDEPRLRALASGRDAMQPFFAAAILDLFDKMQRGELKGMAPSDLYIGIVKRT